MSLRMLQVPNPSQTPSPTIVKRATPPPHIFHITKRDFPSVDPAGFSANSGCFVVVVVGGGGGGEKKLSAVRWDQKTKKNIRKEILVL